MLRGLKWWQAWIWGLIASRFGCYCLFTRDFFGFFALQGFQFPLLENAGILRLHCGDLEVILIKQAGFCKSRHMLDAAKFWLLDIEFIDRFPFKTLGQDVTVIKVSVLSHLFRQSFSVL